MNAKQALKLIKENGVYGLGDYDGCPCCNFSVCGIDVDVSCRKSSGSRLLNAPYGTTVRVYSHHLDSTAADLKIVASEVVRQLKEDSPHTPITLRFCTYEQDDKKKCSWCGKPRERPDGYLCSECPSKKGVYTDQTVADTHAFDVLAADLIAEALCTKEDDE